MKSFEINLVDEEGNPKQLTKQERSEIMAKMYTTPSESSALALCTLNESGDWNAMSDRLKKVNAQVIAGDLSLAEALLIDQSMVLQSIFSSYTSKMANSKYLSQAEAYGKIALRAQNQCQRTLKTLLEYKNPKRTTFIKQQNNAVNQQINDGSDPAEIEEKEISKKKLNSANKLLEINHEERLDIGKTKETIKEHSEVETVGEINRTSHGTG